MSMILNEEQIQLKENAKRFNQEKSPVSELRRLRDEKNELGYDAKTWEEMVELGWPSILIPEAQGGLGLSIRYLGPILEECGRTLTASPLLSTALVGVAALTVAGNETQQQELLPQIATGKLLTALAIEEGARHNPTKVDTTAKTQGDNFILNGEKQFVIDGHIANYLIVSARTSGNSNDALGISLFLVDAKQPGVKVQRTLMVDSRNSAIITFSDAEVSKANLLGTLDQGLDNLNLILDFARVGLAAEMLGSIHEVFDRTVEYLKEREQFGVPIGSFQALKHRAALMFCEIELCKSVVAEGLSVLSAATESSGIAQISTAERNEIALISSICQSQLCETIEEVSNEGVQLHGGIGMTDEHEIGFFLKRARVVQQMFGDATFHKDRYAKLNNY